MIIWLLIPFLLIALLFALAGFGGGSGYTAVLALSGADKDIVRVIALSCNLIVVTSSVVMFTRSKQMPWKLVLPLVICSVPATFFGARMQITDQVFYLSLGVCLIVSAFLLFLRVKESDIENIDEKAPYWMGPILGAPLGFVAGMTGIGGGIYLAPVMHLLRIAPARQVAATSSFFILINSISGLIFHLTKETMPTFEVLKPYLLLPLVVFIGGIFGSHGASKKVPSIWIRRLTGVLIFLVGIRIITMAF